MAATAEAPTTPGTTMRPAPLLALVEVLLGALLDLTVDVDSFDEVIVELVDPLDTGVDDPVVEEVPFICATTEALKLPVMAVRLFLRMSCEQDGIKSTENPRKLGRERFGEGIGLGRIWEAIGRKPDKANHSN